MRVDDNSVFASLNKVSGCRYNRAEYNADIIDTYILRKAREKGVRLPTGGSPEEYKFLGAFVEDTVAGINENVVYCDLASLYPSIIMSLNLSPEVIVGTKQNLQDSEYTEDDCVWGYYDPRPVKHIESGVDWQQYTDGTYKMVYDPEKNSVKWTCDEADGPQHERLYLLSHNVQTGFLTECIQEMIDLKNQYQGTSLYGAVKRITNSAFGVVGFAQEGSSFRLFDWRLAEMITLAGRKIIKGSRDRILGQLHEHGYEDAYACSGDTDATAVSIPSVPTMDEALRVVGEAVDWLNEEEYDVFMQGTFNVLPEHNHTEIEVKSFAPRLFIPSRNPPHSEEGVQKRYVEWLRWDEDDGMTDTIDITGLEAERSDVAPITGHAQELFAETLRMDTSEARGWLFPQLREMAQSITDGEIALSRVCKRGGVGQDISAYGSASRRAGPLYRGAKYANEHVDGVTIQRGDKPAVVYVIDVGGDYPGYYDTHTAEDGDRVDAVSLLDPKRLPEAFTVDWDKHLQKALLGPMKPLLDTRFGADSWDQIRHGHKQTGLATFER